MNSSITLGEAFFDSPMTAFEFLDRHMALQEKQLPTGCEGENANSHPLYRAFLIALFDYYPDRAECTDGIDPDFFSVIRDLNTGHLALCAHFEDNFIHVFSPMRSIMAYLHMNCEGSPYDRRRDLYAVNAPEKDQERFRLFRGNAQVEKVLAKR